MVIVYSLHRDFFFQQRRSVSGIFEGKYGLITLRDLFRWAERYRYTTTDEQFFDWEQLMAEEGSKLIVRLYLSTVIWQGLCYWLEDCVHQMKNNS